MLLLLTADRWRTRWAPAVTISLMAALAIANEIAFLLLGIGIVLASLIACCIAESQAGTSWHRHLAGHRGRGAGDRGCSGRHAHGGFEVRSHARRGGDELFRSYAEFDLATSHCLRAHGVAFSDPGRRNCCWPSSRLGRLCL